MSNWDECRRTVRRYVKARIPLLTVDTIERGRALSVMEKVAAETSMQFYVHSFSRGIYDIQSKSKVSDSRSMAEAMTYAGEQMKKRRGAAIVFTEVHGISTDGPESRLFLDLVTLASESGWIVMIMTSDSVWSRLQRLGLRVVLDTPDEIEMTALVREYVNTYRDKIAVEWDEGDICEAGSLLAGATMVEAQNVMSALVARGSMKRSDMDEVRYAKERLFSDISGLESIRLSGGEDEMGGLENLRSWLNEKKELLTSEKRDAMNARGLRPPRGVMLVGVPGCGKSMSAKMIASMWKLPLYRLDFATVQGSYVGQSEQQLKNALSMAEFMSPCILWIDEIEKGLTSYATDNTGVSTRMVGQFLFWLQECRKQVFVVATANDVMKLPTELLRRGRFDEMFFLDLPTADERREIIRIYTGRYLGCEASCSLSDSLVDASEGFTGADIEAAVRDVAYHTLVNDGSSLNDDMVLSSFSRIVPLIRTDPDRMAAIREWGAERATPASIRKVR